MRPFDYAQGDRYICGHPLKSVLSVCHLNSHLPYIEIQQFPFPQVALQMLADADGTYARRRAGEQQVAHLQCHEAADVDYDVIHTEQHVGRTATLHRSSVDVEVEVQALHVFSRIGQGDEVAYGGGVVETLAQFPRVTLVAKTPLQVAGGEVDAHGHGVVVTGGEAWRDVFAQAADTHHDLSFVVHLLREVGQEERFAVLQNGGVGLQEDDRLTAHVCMSQFLVVPGVVHACCYNLHCYSVE